MTDRGSRSPRIRALILRVHRWLGLTVGVLVVALVATGVLINHAPALGLDNIPVRGDWILRLYHEGLATDMRAYHVGHRWLSWVNGKVVAGQRPVATVDEPPLGAADAGDILVLAFPQRLLLLTPDGAVVESMGPEALPGRLEALAPAADGHGVVVRISQGCARSDPNVVRWRPAPCPEAWSETESPPSDIAAALRRSASVPDIPWERVLLDLHSGRLFGPFGVVVVDLVGLALVVLAASGTVNWWLTRKARGRGPGSGC